MRGGDGAQRARERARSGFKDRRVPVIEPRPDAQKRADLVLVRNAKERDRQLGVWLDGLTPDRRRVALAVIDEQRSDDRRGQIQYGPSLDRRYSERDDGSVLLARYGAVHMDEASA